MYISVHFWFWIEHYRVWNVHFRICKIGLLGQPVKYSAYPIQISTDNKIANEVNCLVVKWKFGISNHTADIL